MIVDLVRITTNDGVILDGVLQRAESKSSLDAVVLVHGTGSNFYQSTFLEFLAERFVERGISALRVNTRGHDGMSTAVTFRGGVRAGAAFENVDDCRHDLAGWMTYLRTHVGPRIGLVGHSLGAVKCVYATVLERLDPACLIAISPPRLSYAWFCESPKREEFMATIRKAEELVSAGQGLSLIDSTVPLPMLISAVGYLEKYGPDERIHFLPHIRRLKCPTLFTFGSKEVESNVAFQKLPDEIPGAITIEGADHFYSGVREALWSAISTWPGLG